MKLFVISVTFLTLLVTSLKGLKCHGLVKNFGNYSKFHTDTGENCTSFSQYCFSVNGIVDTVKNVYIAGCDELLIQPDFKNLLLKCTGNTTTNINTASNKYAFTCCGYDMCNSSYTPKISLGFLCLIPIYFFMNFKI
uniref:Activin_recp domain-containing protein n=1 Tax=Strongyloides venezuelensis TaxID=75913 RepID=A0A0K0FMR2_STRVS